MLHKWQWSEGLPKGGVRGLATQQYHCNHLHLFFKKCSKCVETCSKRNIIIGNKSWQLRRQIVTLTSWTCLIICILWKRMFGAMVLAIGAYKCASIAAVHGTLRIYFSDRVRFNHCDFVAVDHATYGGSR